MAENDRILPASGPCEFVVEEIGRGWRCALQLDGAILEHIPENCKTRRCSIYSAWLETEIAARDARIAELEDERDHALELLDAAVDDRQAYFDRVAELEGTLRDLYGLTIEMETLYSAGWQDIDEYVSGMEKARVALQAKDAPEGGDEGGRE